MTGSGILVSPEWLEQRLSSREIRVIDCSMFKRAGEVGAASLESGRSHWREGHIPGAAYLDLFEHLSAPREGMPYNLPSEAKLSIVLQSIGVDVGTTVVLYGDGYLSAVTRAWWVLRASGVINVKILDGGWPRWRAEGRPVSSAIPIFKIGDFIAERDATLLATKGDVLRAIEDPTTELINALAPEQHRGTGGPTFGRPGRIPRSVNIPSSDLVDPAYFAFKPLKDLRRKLDAAGLSKSKKIIGYCGGGISATTLIVALHLAGFENAALYDGSLMEWATDPSLPMETD